VPTIFAANESAVLVAGEPLEGVLSLEYRRHRDRTNVYAIGSAERIGVVAGSEHVEARLRVASSAPALDAIPPDASFEVAAQLVHGDTTVTVAFDECTLTSKTFELGVGGTGEAVYSFTATRVRESR
jgi:hypothetical protein